MSVQDFDPRFWPCHTRSCNLRSRYFRDRKISLRVRARAYRLALVLSCVVLALAGCSDAARPVVDVNPPWVDVPGGSTTTFTASVRPARLKHGPLLWEVIPANGGTITSKGVYTAPETPGHYNVVAIWTAEYGGIGTVEGSASVDVLSPPQADAVINPDMVEASSASQSRGAIRNGVVVGQSVPFVISAEPVGNIKVGSGFTPPIPCNDCDATF